MSVYAIFVDLVKAYDTVNQELLWLILGKSGIPKKLITILKKLYNDTTISLTIEKIESIFKSTCGVKQGDNLAPILFFIFMNAVTNTLDKKWNFKTPDFRWFPNTKQSNKTRGKFSCISWKNKGTKFTFYQSLYVDDAAFILLNRDDAIEAMMLIATHFKRFGLTIHTGNKRKNEKSKTELIFIPAPGHSHNPSDTEDIFINGTSFISECSSFQYLGSIINNKLKANSDIDNRIKKAQKLFYALNKPVFRCRDLDISLRRRIYVALIVNLLLWGCESWPLTAENRRKSKSFTRAVVVAY